MPIRPTPCSVVLAFGNDLLPVLAARVLAESMAMTPALGRLVVGLEEEDRAVVVDEAVVVVEVVDQVDDLARPARSGP